MHTSNVESIISGNEQLANFWSNCHGWAPDSAADLMSKSRLDRQLSLSKTLLKWNFDSECSDGDLILAWANLGALIEGTLKLFLSVYYEDYSSDLNKIIRKGEQVDPDSLTLENLKQFIRKKDLFGEEWYPYIELVQQRRNAIHSYKDRSIGDKDEFNESVEKYLLFMRCVNKHLPYPEGGYGPRF
ncbi:hypothetical protein [Vibrio sp. S17_S38]|uniref:hypothetical protein n=1 Tax=Vibrio sp. S17_S38 TaxID=2720229 RepID=UPI001932FC2F|nr:hypothetical protein [Vibrio sp. S17_S38]